MTFSDQTDVLTHLLEAVEQPIFWKDLDGRYLGCNRLFAEVIGLESPAEVIGQLDEQLPRGCGEGKTLRELGIRAIEARQSLCRVPVRRLCSGDVIRSYHATMIPLGQSADGVAGVLGILEDVTERQEAEKRLHEIQTALDDACDAICILRSDGRVSYINIAFMELFHCTVEMINELGWESICRHREIVEGVAKTVQGGDSWSGEVELESSRIGRFPGEIRATPIISDSAEIIGTLLFINNISERKKLESKLLHLRKMESIGSLAAGIAHEINTPTQYIGDNVRFLEDAFDQMKSAIEALKDVYDQAEAGRLDASVIEHARTVLEEKQPCELCDEIPGAIADALEGVHSVARIVGAMKEFSHPGVDAMSATDINRAIESAATVARNEWKYVANLVTDFDPALPAIPCIVGEFNQAVLNMIVNAAHAIREKQGDGSTEKGTIAITTKYGGACAEVRIADTGVGIPEGIRACIFDPFFTTKPVGQGTGQGLGIVHSVIVEKHGGTIDVESEPGRGTTFIVRLPVSQTHEACSHAVGESHHV